MKNFVINRKKALLCGAIIIMLLATAGITLAYLIDKTGDVANKFTPTEVTCEVEETFENNIKSNVSIKNTGDIPAYIRATLVFNWVDGQGNIAPESVEAGDYTITWPENFNWEKNADGYYYYLEIVPVDDPATENVDESLTDILISSIVPVEGAAPAGYTLSVEIIADAVQADGVNGDGVKAVVDAWGVDPEELQ